MPSVPIGQKIIGPQGEPYTITDFLGRGAFGEVYRASGESTGVVIAVKLLPVGQLDEESRRIALLNEIKAAKQIDHPNVVKVLHVDEGTILDLGPFACMEYVSGGTLARLLRGQNQADCQIPLRRAIEMMIDIAQGMRAINEKLIHRDVKPDNILIENKTLKIGDFGISKFIDESTRLHTFKGGQHVAYMAPEGWVNDKNTYKLDVYSAGLVFFEILTLKHPFLLKGKDPGTPQEWEKVHLYEMCPDVGSQRKDVPISLSQLIQRMAAKRPQSRPDWQEVIDILSNPTIEPTANRNVAISEAVSSAVAKQQERERKNLESARKEKELENQRLTYRYSWESLLERFLPAVEQFNQECQFGKITVAEDVGGRFYNLPTDGSVWVHPFAPIRTEVKIGTGVVIGGGWIGLRDGRSANLVLLKESHDDLYGRWVVCEATLTAADPSRFFGRLGITEKTIQPFGFNYEHYYEEIQHIHSAHVLNYHLIDNVEDYFAALVAEGCK